MTETMGDEFEGLRERAREVLRIRGLSQAGAAKLAGVPSSTFSAWINGKYEGDNRNVSRQVERWLVGLEEQAQIAAATPALPGFVPTQTASGFMAVCSHAQHTPDMATITGSPGVGKTWAAREYQRTHANVWMWTAAPSTRRLSLAMDGIVLALGLRVWQCGRRLAEIVNRVRDTRGLLIIDEAHNLDSEALDEVRAIHDQGGIGIALIGNHQIYAKIGGGARRAEFAQLHSRIGMRWERVRPLLIDIDALLDASGVVGVAERKLLRAEGQKPGALRRLQKTLRVAQMLAVGDGSEAASERHILDAIRQLGDVPTPTEAL